MDELDFKDDDELLRAKLNSETAQISWQELQRHFARGIVVKVSGDLDIIEVAVAMSKDDKQRFAEWMQQGKVARAEDHDAQDWNERDPVFWSVVAAPFVLVQENPKQRKLDA